MAEEEINKTDAAKEAPISEAPKAAKKAKKGKRIVTSGEMHIKATFNNTIVTFSDKTGAVLSSSSAGANCFRGSKKGTAYAAQIAAEKAAAEAAAKAAAEAEAAAPAEAESTPVAE